MRFRRPILRRPLGTILILGATAGIAYKLGKDDAQKIQEYTGYQPEELSEKDLQAAMTDLNIKSEPLDDDDRREMAAAQSGITPAPSKQAATQGDYVIELQKLAELRDTGIITAEEFEAKKKQLLGL
jgi:hypothetical protein